jgi:hypothetical protein
MSPLFRRLTLEAKTLAERVNVMPMGRAVSLWMASLLPAA